MGHVACTAHSRRVIIIGKKVIHRNGDGSRCASFSLKSHGSVWPRDEVFELIEASNARRVYIGVEEMRKIGEDFTTGFIAGLEDPYSYPDY